MLFIGGAITYCNNRIKYKPNLLTSLHKTGIIKPIFIKYVKGDDALGFHFGHSVYITKTGYIALT